MQIQITLSGLDAAVFACVAADPAEWAANAVQARIAAKRQDLAEAEARRRRDAGEAPLATVEDLVKAALDRASRPVDLVAYAEAARYARETGGITVDGVPIATTDRSKLLIAGARLRADDNLNGVEAFDAADGKQYEMPSAGIVRISKAVGEHVSRVFKVYADVKAHLAAEPPTLTTEAEIDAAFAAVPTAY